MNFINYSLSITSLLPTITYGVDEKNMAVNIVDCKVNVTIEGLELSGHYKIFKNNGELSATFEMLSPLGEQSLSQKTSNVIVINIKDFDINNNNDEMINKISVLASVDLSKVKTIDVYAIEPNDDGGAARIYVFRDEQNSELGKAGQFGWVLGHCQ